MKRKLKIQIEVLNMKKINLSLEREAIEMKLEEIKKQKEQKDLSQ